MFVEYVVLFGFIMLMDGVLRYHLHLCSCSGA